MNFSFPWRTYQERLLSEMGQYLRDNRLHVVAPPGSGKTVLGLEIMRQLDQPCLILCPTLAIRQQWGERLALDFLQGQQPTWLSYDLQQPGTVTITTYQALHAAVKRGEEIWETLSYLVSGTLIVDECHHLQKAWWQSLMKTYEQLSPVLIALTATPPYDVSGYEWQRYQELCGLIDVEISMPELIAEGNLCPHQDYIWFTLPAAEEQAPLKAFQEAITDLLDHLKVNYTFRDHLKAHPWLVWPEGCLEAIYENPTYFSALMIVLEGIGGVAPATAIGIIGADDSLIPEMSLEWLEVFLNEAFYKDAHFKPALSEPYMASIYRRLKKAHAIERGRIYLEEPPHLERRIRQSRSKLEAIGAIAELEYSSMGADLRLLVLTDYIRSEVLPRSELDETEMQKIGVAPIFETLRRTFPIEVEIGVLTGSLLILPKLLLPALKAQMQYLGLSESSLMATALSHDPHFVRLQPQEHLRKQMTYLVTQLFNSGQLQVVVGTNALLGEGWDAPSANTLILATVVKSFVSSNQARGRVIRTDPRQPDKAANIWHLACMDPYHHAGGLDWKKLAQRFRAFAGPSFEPEPRIENGVGRFRLVNLPVNEVSVARTNHLMAEHACMRDRLRREWDQSIQKGVHMAEEITLPVLRTKRQQQVYEVFWIRSKAMVDAQLNEMEQMGILALPLVAAGSVALVLSGMMPPQLLLAGSMLALLGYSLLSFGRNGYLGRLMRLIRQFEAEQQLKVRWGRVGFATGLTALTAGALSGWITGLAVVLLSSAATGLALSVLQGPQLAKAQRQLDEAGDGGLLLMRTGQGILFALRQLNLLSSPYFNIKLHIVQGATEQQGCYLEGVTLQEEQIFLELLGEALGPINNPRYLILRKHFAGAELLSVQHYAVPTVFGQRRADADAYLDALQRQLPEPLELLYTRTFEGRRILLAARAKTLTDPEVRRQTAWR
ncbi:MAG: DEAD/DEAH box helicase family protein [Phaeodactylibacter sp.]|uniref:DEAD/DEAH box helicase family protein n=1 Tax=Phaeodactylibacter sp. TaxID=1940289 RepID=UPI0032EB0B73